MKVRQNKDEKWTLILLFVVLYFVLLVMISRVRCGVSLGAMPFWVLGAAILMFSSLIVAKCRRKSETESAGGGDFLCKQKGQNDWEKWFDFLGKIAICAFAVFVFCRAFLGPMWYAEIDTNALPTISLQYRGSYTINEEDLQQAQIDFPQLYAGINSFDDLRSSKLVVTRDGRWMPYYGPIYPLLCIPVKLLLALFHLDQQRCFFLTNAILIISALVFLQRKLKASSAQRFFALLLLMISPIVFYVNYINYEACIFSLLIISLTLYYNNNYKLSALFLSLAGIANSTVMAIGIVMIVEYFIRMTKEIKNAPEKKCALKSCVVETIIYGCCFLPCLIPFVMQWILLGKGLFTGAASNNGVLSRFFSYLFDPSLGFFSFAPFAVIAFFSLGIVSLFKKRCAERWRTVFWLLFLVGTVLAYSFMYHINCGMIYCARYIVWTYPILVIFLATVGYEVIRSVSLRRVVCIVLVASPLFLITVNLSDALNYYHFNSSTRWILDRVPQFYRPLSSIFYSRTLYEDGAYWHTEPAYYTDPETDEVRKLLYKAYSGVEEEIEWDLTGDEASIQYLHAKLRETEYDGQFHYLNFPRNGAYQLRKKTLQEKGEFVPGKVLIDEQNVFLVSGAGMRSATLPTTISANTFYKLEIELNEDFDFDDADGLFVDFWGDHYDYSQQESYFLVPGRHHYELYFNSGDYDWETKDIIVRFICASSKKSQEAVRIAHFTLTESDI